MSSAALETFLARLYTDADSRRRFEADPQGEAARAGVAPADCLALAQCDGVGLQMAAGSFGRKRAQHGKPRRSLLQRWLGR